MKDKPIDKIQELSKINMQIFSIIDCLADYDVNLARQKLRDATIDVSAGMAKIASEYEISK